METHSIDVKVSTWTTDTKRTFIFKIVEKIAITLFSLERFHTIKNKGALLASMVLWRTLNIHGTFPLHKRLFIVQNIS